jgi:hypothetical protein
MAFYDHPFVVEKRCKRRVGVGFAYAGRRLLGVTEFIRRSYFPRFTANRRGGGAREKVGRKSRNLGIRMGSRADSAITAYVKTGNMRKMATCPTARRLMEFLLKNNLSIVDAHVLICEPTYNIATEIDVLCHGNSGLVVIENKTTLQTRAQHEQTYRSPDREFPTLLHGLARFANSEYTHHQLQLACMLIMLKNTYNVKATGYIILASSDSLNHYPMCPIILNAVAAALNTRAHFSPSIVRGLCCPAVAYKFREFLPRVSLDLDKEKTPIAGQLIPQSLPSVVQLFLQKNAPTSEIIYNPCIGDLSFHERPDVVISVNVDIFVESESKIYLFNLQPVDTCAKSDIHLPTGESPPLPNGSIASAATLAFLKLTLAAKASIAQQKKIELRVVFIPTTGQPFLRLVNAKFQKTVS